MKKTIYAIIITSFMAGTIFTACQSPSQKLETAMENENDATEKVTEAKRNLNQELSDSISQFKKDNGDKLIANEKNITEFKALISKQNKEYKTEFKQKLSELENRNTNMENALIDYQEEGKENWNLFKVNFKRNMNEIDISIKDFLTKK